MEVAMPGGGLGPGARAAGWLADARGARAFCPGCWLPGRCLGGALGGCPRKSTVKAPAGGGEGSSGLPMENHG